MLDTGHQILNTRGVWFPEIIRGLPSQSFCFRWIVPADAEPRDPEMVIPGAVQRSGVELTAATADDWTVIVPWRTLVYGFIRRDVDEAATLTLQETDSHVELRLECLPAETHAAHFAGALGAAVMAAAAWMIGGVVPALTVLVGCGLWADATRVMAMQALELRLRRLLSDAGLELWPDAPAELLPPLR